VVFENHIGVCLASFEAQVYSSRLRSGPMNYPGWDCERFPWPQAMRPIARDIDLEFALEHKKAFVRFQMLVPGILALHHSETHAMIVDPGNHEVSICFRHASGFRSQINLR